MRGQQSRDRIAIAALSLLAVIAQPLAPAIITVKGGCTLADAITAANTDAPVGSCPAGDPGEDIIVLTGDIVLTSVDNDTDGPNGLPSITSEIAIRGGGFTISRDDSASQFRILHVAVNGTLGIEFATITNGYPGGWFNYEDGGGIFSEGALTLTGSTVSGNATSGTPSRGGGIYSAGTLTLVDSTVSDNRSGYGAGILIPDGGAATLISSTISGNVSRRQGGGMLVRGAALLTNSTVSGNESSGGYYGGGIGVGLFGNATIISTTVTQNSAMGWKAHGAGIGWANHASNEVELSNSVVAGNTAVDNPVFSNCSREVTDGGGNLDDDGSCGPGAGFLTGLDPTLAANGGPSQTHALLEGSSAIDGAGDCGLEADQRGRVRGDGPCDSGAFEHDAALPLTVTGECPGNSALELSGATPRGTVALAGGIAEGSTILPGGPCPGVELDLADATHLGTFTADSSGTWSAALNLPSSACGLFTQALDVETCAVSTVVQIP